MIVNQRKFSWPALFGDYNRDKGGNGHVAYPLSFVTQIFYDDQPNHDAVRIVQHYRCLSQRRIPIFNLAHIHQKCK